MKFSFLFIVLLLLLSGCKSQKKKSDVPATNFFVSDYLRGQIAMMDTVRHPFLKIETVDGHTDSSILSTIDVKTYTKDFLNLPDISSEKLKDDYDVSQLYDDLQEAFIFTYTTKQNHPVQQENVTVEPQPNAKGQNDIRSVYADLWNSNKDTSIRKNMLWEANKSFQINTIIDVPGQPEKISSVRIIWNGFDSVNRRER